MKLKKIVLTDKEIKTFADHLFEIPHGEIMTLMSKPPNNFIQFVKDLVQTSTPSKHFLDIKEK